MGLNKLREDLEDICKSFAENEDYFSENWGGRRTFLVSNFLHTMGYSLTPSDMLVDTVLKTNTKATLPVSLLHGFPIDFTINVGNHKTMLVTCKEGLSIKEIKHLHRYVDKDTVFIATDGLIYDIFVTTCDSTEFLASIVLDSLDVDELAILSCLIKGNYSLDDLKAYYSNIAMKSFITNKTQDSISDERYCVGTVRERYSKTFSEDVAHHDLCRQIRGGEKLGEIEFMGKLYTNLYYLVSAYNANFRNVVDMLYANKPLSEALLTRECHVPSSFIESDLYKEFCRRNGFDNY